MMILMPMAGAGQRFFDKGYTTHKPAIPVIDHRTGKELPMVVCAMRDIPLSDKPETKMVFVDRDFHKRDGLEDMIRSHYPQADFITLNYLTQGQASTCLLAKPLMTPDESLLIAACDNGMIYNPDDFTRLAGEADVLVFTHTHSEAAAQNPKAYGWIATDAAGNVTAVSVKKALSETPYNDAVIVGTFWFRESRFFTDCAGEMIAANDRINNEFYVDKCLDYALKSGLKVKNMPLQRYLCWGTPDDYEGYQKTIQYWEGFCREQKL